MELISLLTTSVCQLGLTVAHAPDFLGGSDTGDERLDNILLSVCQSKAMKRRQKKTITKDALLSYL